MQRRFRGRAQPRHVAGVRRDFRFNQDYVHFKLKKAQKHEDPR
jgi:hypothetical protein